MALDPITLQNTMDDPAQQVDMTPAPTGPVVSLNTANNQGVFPSPDIAAMRAAKATMGLQPVTGANYSDLYTSIINGDEGSRRQENASAIDEQHQQKRDQGIINLANSTVTPFSPEAVQSILDAPSAKPVDPNTVFEQAYATAFNSAIQKASVDMEDTSYDNLQSVFPDILDHTIATGDTTLAKREYAVRQAENARTAAENQSWVGWGVNQAAGLIPFRQAYKLHGLVQTPEGIWSILPGTDLDNQTQALLSLPMDQYTKKFDDIMTKLKADDPGLAETWASAVVGRSATERTLDNVLPLIDLAGLADLGLAAKGVIKSVRDANAVRRATRDVIQAASEADAAAAQAKTPEEAIQAVQAVASEAAGNTADAGVKRAANNAVSDFQGSTDPIKRTVEWLQSTLRADIDAAKATPGSLSREQLVQLESTHEQFSSRLQELITNLVKVQNVPLMDATTGAYQVFREATIRQFPGIQNAIADVSAPVYNRLANTYSYDLKITNFGNELFTSPEAAEGFAKLHNIGEARIETAPRSAGSTEVTGFRTAKGSTYEIEPGTGKTTRNKAARPEHPGDEGLQPKSSKTVYVTMDNANALAIPSSSKDWKFVDHGDGTMSLATKNGKTYGISPSQRARPFETEPREGLVPLELWNKRGRQYSNAHFGNEITELTRAGAGQTYYIPETAAKTMGTTGGMKIVKGEPTFYTDLKNDVSIAHTTTPEIGMVPVDVSGAGRVTFRPTLKTDAEVSVVQQGLGYYLRITKPIDARGSVFRDGLVRTADDKSLSNQDTGRWAQVRNAVIGRIRTPEDTLARTENANRKIALYAQGQLQKLAAEQGRYINDVISGRFRFDPVTGEPVGRVVSKVKSYLPGPGAGIDRKQIRQDFARTLDNARRMKDPNTGEQGYFFRNPEELQDYYQMAYQRSPTFQETQAYFAFTRSYEFDRIQRNLAVYSNKSRVGTEVHTFLSKDTDGNLVKSPGIEGVARKSLPGGTSDTIAVMSKTAGNEAVHPINGIPDKLREEIQNKLATGRGKLVEIYDPEQRPLSNFGSGALKNKRVRYVYSEQVDTTPLDINQVPRRGGGHFEYDYNHYIKQPKIQTEINGSSVRNIYEGDQTLMPIANRAMGEEYSKHLNDFRELLRQGKTDEAKQLLKDRKMGIEYKEAKSWFTPKKDAEGNIIPARFSLTEEFRMVRRGRSIAQMDNKLKNKFTDPLNSSRSTFEDGTTSGSLARQFQVQYTGERDSYDLFTVNNVGSRFNPVFKYEPAAFVDPVTTLNRGMNRLINSAFMNDYKIYAVEHWLEENADLLKASKGEVRSAPFYHFHLADTDGAYLADADPFRKAIAKSNLMKINSFIGQPNSFDRMAQNVTQYLADQMYTHIGPQATIVSRAYMPKLKDPLTYMRSAAFDLKMGLYALPQFFAQMMNWTTVLALAGPTHTLKASAASLFYQWAKFTRDPAIIEHMDNMLTKFGWKTGEFKESLEILDKRTGFAHVGGETAMLDDTASSQYVRGDIRKFLDFGRVFFRAGEEGSRLVSFYAALSEHRVKNLVGAVSDKDLTNIINRADTLNVNMSRASASILHTGIMSMPGQFLAYQLRLAELFWSKRIGETASDRALARARLYLTYASMYGGLSAAGVTGLPITDALRDYATKNGYVVGDNFLTHLAAEGIPSTILRLIDGHGDFRAGKTYNFGDRFGAQGFTFIRDALYGDKKWWELAGGATASIGAGLLKDFSGFTSAMMSMLRGDNDKKRWTLTSDDILNAAHQISSVNQATRGYLGWTTGNWISQNGQDITDVTKAQSVFMAAMGLNPQSQVDQYRKGQAIAAQNATYKAAIDLFTTELRYAHTDAALGNTNQADSHYKNAWAALEAAGVPDEMKKEALAKANRGFENKIDATDDNYYTRNVPKEGDLTTFGDPSQIRMDAWKRTKQLQQYQKDNK